MRYVKPHFYDQFTCTADKCPDTCCAGWQIVIDEESLEKYSQMEGPLGNRLLSSIDWEEGIFKQNAGRCAFLNEKDLCDLQAGLGEEALCKTCHMYPRHVEEFEGVRELSLSLSCPVAAQMILECEEPVRLLEEETDEEEELWEEFEDFDFLLFTQLSEARGLILDIVQERGMDMRERMSLVLELAKEMQECIDEERYCDVDDTIEKFRQLYLYRMRRGGDRNDDESMVLGGVHGEIGERSSSSSAQEVRLESRYTKMCREYTVLNRLERLRDEWSDVLSDAWMTLYEDGQKNYEDICRRFEKACGYESENKEQWERMAEQLMVFFVFTYFCGAVYDEWIYSKMSLAVFSTMWIQELIMAEWEENEGKISREKCVELAYRYAREIEHSDENLDLLEEWLQENYEA